MKIGDFTINIQKGIGVIALGLTALINGARAFSDTAKMIVASSPSEPIIAFCVAGFIGLLSAFGTVVVLGWAFKE